MEAKSIKVEDFNREEYEWIPNILGVSLIVNNLHMDSSDNNINPAKLYIVGKHKERNDLVIIKSNKSFFSLLEESNKDVRIYHRESDKCYVCVKDSTSIEDLIEEVNKLEPIEGEEWYISPELYITHSKKITNPNHCMHEKNRLHYELVIKPKTI